MWTRATPDIIREIGLRIIDSCSDGIRLSELFNEVAEYLTEKGVEVEGDNQIRNSLWDIADRFPDRVVKIRISSRRVILVPKREEHRFSSEAIPDDGVLDGALSGLSGSAMLLMIRSNITRLLESVQFEVLEAYIKSIDESDLKEATYEDMKLYFDMVHVLEQLKKIDKSNSEFFNKFSNR